MLTFVTMSLTMIKTEIFEFDAFRKWQTRILTILGLTAETNGEIHDISCDTEGF